MAKKTSAEAWGFLKPLPEDTPTENDEIVADEPEETAAPSTATRQRQKTGKRSDPDYIQVGAYLPKALYKRVKRKMLDDDRDFSDVVANLLDKWLSE